MSPRSRYARRAAATAAPLLLSALTLAAMTRPVLAAPRAAFVPAAAASAPTTESGDALLAAVAAGDAGKAADALRAGAPVDARDPRTGRTALMLAAGSGRGDLVRLLLDKNADVDARDADGRTALHLVLAAAEESAASAPASPDAEPKKEEKPRKRRGFGGGLGKITGGLSDLGASVTRGKIGDAAKKLGAKALGAVGGNSLLASLLPGGPALQMLARGLMNGGLNGGVSGGGLASLLAPGASFTLGGASGWSGVLGAALLGGANGGGDASASLHLMGALDNILASTGRNAVADAVAGVSVPSPSAVAMNAATAGAWMSLFGAAGGHSPDLLKAVGNLGDGATAEERAAWAAFVEAARDEDEERVTALMSDPKMLPLLGRAAEGLRAAADRIPGRDGGADIARALLSRGADASATDKAGRTALTRARTLGLDALAGVLAGAADAKKP